MNGIGDTIRISYANDPIYEVQDGLDCLHSGLRRGGGGLIGADVRRFSGFVYADQN